MFHTYKRDVRLVYSSPANVLGSVSNVAYLTVCSFIECLLDPKAAPHGLGSLSNNSNRFTQFKDSPDSVKMRTATPNDFFIKLLEALPLSGLPRNIVYPGIKLSSSSLAVRSTCGAVCSLRLDSFPPHS
jgi:hypothetical protein